MDQTGWRVAIVGGIVSTVAGGLILNFLWKPPAQPPPPPVVSSFEDVLQRMHNLQVRTFEAGFKAPEREARHYSSDFTNRSAPLIWWDLSFEFPHAKATISFPIRSIYVGPLGEFGEQTIQATIHYGETSGHWEQGWGGRKPGFWTTPGDYRVDLYMRDSFVASVPFKVVTNAPAAVFGSPPPHQ